MVASTSRHNAPWEASIVVAWPLASLWISNFSSTDDDDADSAGIEMAALDDVPQLSEGSYLAWDDQGGPVLGK